MALILSQYQQPIGNLEAPDGRGLAAQLVTARNVRLVDGGNNNKLGNMRVPETLIWAAFLIHEVSANTSVSLKTASLCVCVARQSVADSYILFFFVLLSVLARMLRLLACGEHRGPSDHLLI